MPYEMELGFFQHRLHRGGHVGIQFGNFLARMARRSEAVYEFLGINCAEGRAIRPGHFDTGGPVDEIVQVQLKLAIPLEPEDIPKSVQKTWLAIGSQSLDLAFVPKFRKSQPLRHRG